MSVRWRIVVNPTAGDGRAIRALPAVRAELDRQGLPCDVHITRDLEHARVLARAAAADADPGHILALGGDGLVGALAGALAGTSVALGILPGGRGNDLARSLGIPLSPVAAARTLPTAAARPIDLGTANHRTFAGIASCGLDSAANRIANATRRIRGRAVYGYSALRALAGFAPMTFTVAVDDGAPRRLHACLVAAANARSYGGGMRLAPAARLDDGRLDVVIVHAMSRAGLLALMPTVFGGGHVRHPKVEVIRARRVEISAESPLELYADGDPVAALPARIEVRPRAVRMLVPGVAAPVPTREARGEPAAVLAP